MASKQEFTEAELAILPPSVRETVRPRVKVQGAPSQAPVAPAAAAVHAEVGDISDPVIQAADVAPARNLEDLLGSDWKVASAEEVIEVANTEAAAREAFPSAAVIEPEVIAPAEPAKPVTVQVESYVDVLDNLPDAEPTVSIVDEEVNLFDSLPESDDIELDEPKDVEPVVEVQTISIDEEELLSDEEIALIEESSDDDLYQEPVATPPKAEPTSIVLQNEGLDTETELDLFDDAVSKAEKAGALTPVQSAFAVAPASVRTNDEVPAEYAQAVNEMTGADRPAVNPFARPVQPEQRVDTDEILSQRAAEQAALAAASIAEDETHTQPVEADPVRQKSGKETPKAVSLDDLAKGEEDEAKPNAGVDAELQKKRKMIVAGLIVCALAGGMYWKTTQSRSPTQQQKPAILTAIDANSQQAAAPTQSSAPVELPFEPLTDGSVATEAPQTVQGVGEQAALAVEQAAPVIEQNVAPAEATQVAPKEQVVETEKTDAELAKLRAELDEERRARRLAESKLRKQRDAAKGVAVTRAEPTTTVAKSAPVKTVDRMLAEAAYIGSARDADGMFAHVLIDGKMLAVHVGDVIAGKYRVEAVSANSVTIEGREIAP